MQENIKRENMGMPKFQLVSIVAAFEKKDHGRHYQLTAQVQQANTMETYDIDIFHKVKKNSNGVVIKEQYILSKFVDSDAAWLGGFKKEKLHIRFNTERTESGHEKDDETCMCPPALSSWKCSTKEYQEIMDGTRCEYYRLHPQGSMNGVDNGQSQSDMYGNAVTGGGRRLRGIGAVVLSPAPAPPPANIDSGCLHQHCPFGCVNGICHPAPVPKEFEILVSKSITQ